MKINIYPPPLWILFERGNCAKRFLSGFLQCKLFINFFVVLTILGLFSTTEVTAQNFFPLKVGNAYQIQNDWFWSLHSWGDSGTDYINLTVQSDTVINGQHYFALHNNINRYQVFNDVTLFSYDSLNQKLYVWLPNDSSRHLAVDFNIPTDSNFVSYIRGTGVEFTSNGFSTKVVFGDTCLVYSMVHPLVLNVPYYYYEFASNIGLIKYKYYIVSTYSDDSSEQETIATIIDSVNYNQFVPTVDSLFPVEDRPVNTFPYLMTIPYTAIYSALVDSFYLDVEHLRSDTLVQNKIFSLSNSNPSHITFYLDSLQVGDKIKLRATITDTSIFNNSDHYPDTGWVVMNVLPPIVTVEDENIPLHFNLAQNYPNPFNPITKISFQIPQQLYVTIKIFDVLGNEIAILVQEEKEAGGYELTWKAENLTSGIYYYRITAGDFTQTKKMILLK